MSSVTRFLKQVPAGLNFYSVPVLGSLYEFVPSSSNTVGNYPPGAMVQAVNSATLLAALQTNGVYSASAVGTAANAGYVLRDMGKVVKASVASTEANAAAGTVSANTEQHFRMFQIVKPIAGNTDGASGVQGASAVPNLYADYFTVFLPTQVTLTGSLISGSAPILGGSM
jgi:hypothetical protein